MSMTACCPCLLLLLATAFTKDGLGCAESESDMLYEDGPASVCSPACTYQCIRVICCAQCMSIHLLLVLVSCSVKLSLIIALPTLVCCIQHATPTLCGSLARSTAKYMSNRVHGLGRDSRPACKARCMYRTAPSSLLCSVTSAS